MRALPLVCKLTSSLIFTIFTTVFLTTTLPATSLAQVKVIQGQNLEFLDLGHNPETNQTTIVGHNIAGTRTPALFTPTENSFTQQVLANLPGATGNATTVKISPDGTRSAGFSPSPLAALNDFEGATWLTSAPNTATGIGFIPGLPNGSTAFAAWRDGVVGQSGNGQRAITWTPASGIQALPGTGNSTSIAIDTTEDGSIQVGVSSVDVTAGAAYYWDSTGIHRLNDNIPNTTLVDSVATSISPDGNYIGGDITAQDINGNVRTFAVIWVGPNRDLVILRDANGVFVQGSVNDISNSGYAVGIFVQTGNNFSNGFIWHANFTNGATPFETWLASRQSNFAPQFQSRVVTAISEDINSGILRFTATNINVVNAVNNSFFVEVNAPEIQDLTRFSLWNSFLNMWNILEIINNTAFSQDVSVNTFDITGNLINTQTFSIEPGIQQDLLVHDFQGVTPNSYGIITIDGAVTGRMVYYRPVTQQGTDFDFAFAIPLNANPSTGTTGVGYNTFEPSNAPVSNWLSLVNLEDQEQIITVNRFSQQGTLLDQREFALPPRTRIDIDGGHQFPGRFNVGFLEIVPQNPSAKYIAQLIRYGIQTNGLIDFAFPLLSKSPSNVKITAPANTFNNSDNWLEVINPNNFPINVDISFFNSQGALNTINSETIAPKAQIHYYINSQIGNNEIGSVDIFSASPMLTNSMVYEGITGGQPLQTMYGLQAVQSTPNVFNNSYNMFLNMQNILRINNLSNQNVTFTVEINSVFAQAPGSTNTFSIAPRFSGDLDLSDFATFGTAPNTYGSITVTTTNQDAIQAYVLRRHFGTNGVLDFAAPTLSQ